MQLQYLSHDLLAFAHFPLVHPYSQDISASTRFLLDCSCRRHCPRNRGRPRYQPQESSSEDVHSLIKGHAIKAYIGWSMSD